MVPRQTLNICHQCRSAHLTPSCSAFPPPPDDLVASFSLDRAPVRGQRHARFGPNALDPILRRHAYPRPVAMLLGGADARHACGPCSKTDGRLVVQAQGQVRFAARGGASMAAYLRGYARMAEGAETLANANRMPPAALLGAKLSRADVDEGDDKAPFQGIVPL